MPALRTRPRRRFLGVTQLVPQLLHAQRHRDTLGVLDRSAVIGGDREARHGRKRTRARRTFAGTAGAKQGIQGSLREPANVAGCTGFEPCRIAQRRVEGPRRRVFDIERASL